ncbi:YihY/virulence factor BrkB family protein [Oceanobacillus jordanicus]|uniref:YihY/virulence factor BrkB family protein n=1 Tax=Oceanobacillus jordanicus TaxID=2867266 RepID=A0AAW5BD64_9BACI|nr:YihY/virulence factor BrkB family protein [Oceanobacillus jordanicus]MCG3420903.1 YihY/virulence factor BrkB family protein [Oceanobacillus jordanicus]
MKKVKAYGKKFIEQFQKDNVPILSAAQAYYYFLSIFPLIVVCFALIPYFNINPQDAVTFIGNILPSEIASVFEENIVSLVDTQRGGLLTVGIIGALWSSSAGINAFIKSTNEAYHVEETRNFLVVRLISLGLTLGMIVTLVVAILVPVFGDVILSFVSSIVGFSGTMEILLQILRWAVSLLAITGFLLILYRFAPNKRIPFKYIFPGALTASILWLLISLGFSFYISNFSNYSATYGSLGGIIVLMIWFFLTGMVLMIGAVVNVLNYRHHHSVEETSQASNM